MLSDRDHPKVRRALQRGFWAAMLVVHTPAWLAACGLGSQGFGAWDVGRGLFLTASQLLFALKLADVPWLRCSLDRRRWVALLVCLGLLHSGAMQRLVTDASASRADLFPPAPVAALAAVVFGALSIRGPRRGRRSSGRPPAMQPLVWARLLQAYLPPRYLLLVGACPVTRAPPR